MQARRLAACVGLLAALLAAARFASAQVVLTQGTNLAVDVSRKDGRLTMDLLGNIWVLPPNGGAATLLTESLLPARRPRWSPDGERILFQASAAGGSQLWIVDAGSAESRRLDSRDYFDQQASWHPDGERIVFSSDRRSSGFDIWEMDLDSGLAWRLTSDAGDETEPAWSANGRHLVYVRHEADRWSLVLRRFGEADTELVVSDTPLASPSWRPDGTLITYLRKMDDQYALWMVILSDPPLERQLTSGEDYFLAPVSWRDRQQLYYTSDGRIKTREFDEWTARPVAFRATIGGTRSRQAASTAERDLPLVTPPEGKLVIRAARIYDGLTQAYREEIDVLLDGGTIEAVVPRQEWPETTILDLGGTTLIPGLIDAYSALPDGSFAGSGAELLSYGVTTLVATGEPDVDPALWDSEQTPGPRLLRAIQLAAPPSTPAAPPVFLVVAGEGAAPEPGQRQLVREWQDRGAPVLAESWVVGLGLGADLLLSADALPASPLGNRYQDIKVAAGSGPTSLVSGLADAGTPGLSQLFRSRQAARHRGREATVRRLASLPDFRSGNVAVIVGSRPSRLPPGLATHAELRALAATGLGGGQVLQAAGRNAARMLGLGGKIGEITPGARADLVLVAGDPLGNIGDALNIVAVVRNGRFYSLISLLERAREGLGVE